jgi:transcriptional enhancer factor
VSALVRYPPIGKKKYIIDGKPRGRNELVAEAIVNETGIPRCRKKVSSHLQVLKPKVAEQPLRKKQTWLLPLCIMADR